MNTMKSTWPSAVAGAVLIGGGLLMNYGTEVPSAGVQAVSANQLTVMINKLNQIVAPVGKSSTKQLQSTVDTGNSPASRFVVAFPGAVLDKHTGLVWEEMPDTTLRTWADATRYCVTKTVGGTIGWRLPSMEELKSVQDPSMAAPFVPMDIFTDVQSTTYWSVSTSAKAPIGVSFVHFVDDRVSGSMKSDLFPAWCVRGGVNTEQY
jgi:hypothetical protein